MNNLVVYSVGPHSESSTDAEVQAEARSRHLCPERRAASWQHDDGDEEMNHQVADIMAATRPLRLRA